MVYCNACAENILCLRGASFMTYLGILIDKDCGDEIKEFNGVIYDALFLNSWVKRNALKMNKFYGMNIEEKLCCEIQ